MPGPARECRCSRGIGAETPIATAPGRDDRAGDDVDEMDRHQTLGHRHLAEVADAPQVVGALDGHDATAMLPGPHHGQCHRLFADDLSETVSAVNGQQSAGVEHDLAPVLGLSRLPARHRRNAAPCPRPWESWPLRLASTRLLATVVASSGLLRLAMRIRVTVARKASAELVLDMVSVLARWFFDQRSGDSGFVAWLDREDGNDTVMVCASAWRTITRPWMPKAGNCDQPLAYITAPTCHGTNSF